MIIGLAGKAKSGKNEAAKVLVAEGYTELAFADAMKRMLLQLGFNMSSLWGPSENRARPYLLPGGLMQASRVPLQTLGTWGRSFWPDCWVLRVEQAIEELSGGGCEYAPHIGVYPLPRTPAKRNFVITDVRFKNEMEFIRRKDGLLLRIKRSAGGLQGSEGQHESETEMDTVPDEAFHHVVMNDGTRLELHAKLQQIINACGLCG